MTIIEESGDIVESLAAIPVIEVETARRINFAFAQNDVPVLRSLAISNPTDTVFEKLELTLSAEPSVLRAK